jgi:NADH-quinone oxidoreductase subunit N
MFASAILVYGMTWVYGITGSTDLDEIAAHLQGVVTGSETRQPEILFALLLVVVGLAFKIAAVPFHMWTPDAYDGAPTPISGFMSVAPKAAGFAAIIRLMVQGLGPLREDWYLLIAILATLTMIFGNLVAISQRNVKRMLAYSSIAHTGYMLVGLAAYNSSSGEGRFVSLAGDTAQSDPGITSLLYYLFAYAFVNIGAFAVITWVQHRGTGMMLEDFAGLGQSNPLAAFAMTIFMVSLMGVPPLLGFYAKYYVIVAAINADLLWLAVAIVLASAISAYFYLRVVATMYFSAPTRELRVVSTPLLNVGIAVMVIANLALGLFSNQVLDLADYWSGAMQVAQAVASR